MHTALRTALSATALLLLLAPASATIVVRVGVDDLTDHATVVVRGEVLDSTARWTDDRSTINTYVRIRVAEVLKGEAGDEIVATCYGGTVGDESVRVEGVPRFRKGEEVVVFLWKNKRDELIPLGLNQGKFVVERHPDTGERIVRNSLEGLSLVRKPGSRAGAKVNVRPDVMTLEELETRVRTRLDERRAETTPEGKPDGDTATPEPVEPEPKEEPPVVTPEEPKPDVETPPVEKPVEPKPAPVKEQEKPAKEKDRPAPAK